MVGKTMFCLLEGPANALATNREGNQVVVAGRNVFKVYNIEEEEFMEKLNLRVGKNLSLNFSCADVQWNPVEDHVLATAATNGAVITWNLNKSSRSKQDIVFQDHRRTVNKVSFHNTEPHLLISGSQDGSMKCFDLRKKEAASTFYSLSESVRDVQFCPHSYFAFTAVQENGNVQMWDMRRTDRCERQFTAHSGPVFTCDWHPEEKRWLATAGRDKTIKVWDMTFKPIVEHCIQTIASVAHIKWRPQRKFNIASSSLVVDFAVSIWDVRRPYVPFAAFNDHRDITTAFAWRHDPHLLLSTSKDSTLYQHLSRDAIRPADQANPVGLDINGAGDVCFAVSDKISEGTTSIKGGAYSSSTRLPMLFRKVPSLNDSFRSMYSTMVVLKNIENKDLSMDWFVKSAQQYQLMGSSLSELCEHNAVVAAELQRPQVAQTWKILKITYSSGSGLVQDFATAVVERVGDSEPAVEGTQEGATQWPSRHSSGNNLHNRHLSGNKVGSRHVSGGGSHGTGEWHVGDTSGQTEDDGETSDTDHDRTLTNIASGMGNNNSDFFFGDGDKDRIPTAFMYNQIPSLDASQDWTLPNEAFQPRHAIQDCSPPPEIANAQSLANSFSEDDGDADPNGVLSDGDDSTRLLTASIKLVLPEWSHTESVVEMLHSYAAQGDTQMPVSVLIILGDRLKGSIDEVTMEQWFLAYIEDLSRFRLWNVANQVIHMCSLPSINTLNQQSTVVHTMCSRCQREIPRVGWLCDRCKILPGLCSVCNQVVRGLFVWCQGCAHGGHLNHLQEWFRDYPWCPSGCGHQCEYT